MNPAFVSTRCDAMFSGCVKARTSGSFSASSAQATRARQLRSVTLAPGAPISHPTGLRVVASVPDDGAVAAHGAAHILLPAVLAHQREALGVVDQARKVDQVGCRHDKSSSREQVSHSRSCSRTRCLQPNFPIPAPPPRNPIRAGKVCRIRMMLVSVTAQSFHTVCLNCAKLPMMVGCSPQMLRLTAEPSRAERVVLISGGRQQQGVENTKWRDSVREEHPGPLQRGSGGRSCLRRR